MATIMFEKLFEFLFKFKPIQFVEGKIGFQSGFSVIFFFTLLIVLCVGIFIIYRRTNVYMSRRTSLVSLVLRLLALTLLFFPLCQPVLMVPDIIPNENFLVVLADKSASMQIEDGHFGQTRDEDVNIILNDDKNGIIRDLNENYKVRHYVFGKGTERVDSLTSYLPDEKTTNISNALKRVAADFKNLPLAGIIFLTDGGDNSLDDPYDMINELKSLNIPLHIVGLGETTFEQERELLQISTGKGIEEGAGAEIDVKVRSWIEETDPVTFNIYRGDRRVFSENRYLKGKGRFDYFTLFYEPDEEGTIEYSLQIQGLPNEINTDNNSLSMLIDTQKDTIRVLYFEGRLRSDFKFIKRALEGDPIFEITSVSRTGTDKYYRQGIRKPDELSKGFPLTEEALYRYKAVLFGDLEASNFTAQQFEMVERFVRRRGGGFMMLGGLNSFSEREYWDTPIADILPVEIDPVRNRDAQAVLSRQIEPDRDDGFQFMPTEMGLESPILKLASERSTNRAVWHEMPRLTSINYFSGVKPGATVLANKPVDDHGGEEPLLVIQRYGRGRSAALGTSSTWRWKMLLDAENNRHERFWSQMVRWLVTSALENVNIEITDNVVEPGENVPIRVSVFDDDFNPLNFVEVKGHITDPSGQDIEIPFHPELIQEGDYISEFVPNSQGVYAIEVVVNQNGDNIGSSRQSILARPSKKEFYDATLKQEFLENLAREAGGMFYTPQEASEIPFNLINRKSETSITRTKYLWDMPFIYLLMILLLSAEWWYRRRRGLH